MSKVSGEFKTAINNHLQALAAKDELFAETLKKPAKNLDDCCTYILNQVQKSGIMGYSDAEVFGMAVHYYDENEIEIGKEISCKVIVNRTIELSQEDKDKAHKIALDQAIAKATAQITSKPVKKAAAPVTSQSSLF